MRCRPSRPTVGSSNLPGGAEVAPRATSRGSRHGHPSRTPRAVCLTYLLPSHVAPTERRLTGNEGHLTLEVRTPTRCSVLARGIVGVIAASVERRQERSWRTPRGAADRSQDARPRPLQRRQSARPQAPRSVSRRLHHTCITQELPVANQSPRGTDNPWSFIQFSTATC